MDNFGGGTAEALVNDMNDLWKRCGVTLREQVSDATWRTWLQGLNPEAYDGDLLVLSAPSSIIRERVENRFLDLIAAAATDVASHEVKVRLDLGPMSVADPLPLTSLLDQEHTSPNASNAPDQGDNRSGRSGSRRAAAAEDRDVGSLDARYTFDAFVIGSSNRFAHAAAQAVAEMPAKSYNPLFIHGDAGLGKTHLLHAIGNYVRENFAGRRVRYVSTETFLNEFVDAIRNNTTMAFKRRYRECDVLLIDDVQFMENKEALQEEFFHTFNHLYGASRQVVLTSDRPPSPSPRSRTASGAASCRGSSPTSSPPSSRPAWPSCRRSSNVSPPTCPTRSSSSSPPT